jgi:hypothetical protein
VAIQLFFSFLPNPPAELKIIDSIDLDHARSFEIPYMFHLLDSRCTANAIAAAVEFDDETGQE